ncbi:TPA: hypothetical protein NIC78_002787 [Pseudomonas aeruginosa]|uniref:hypothetical protein n=1 Tax=Pseudomonas aeruginosa TaxID=287 RepID=UPI0018A299D7|nr:hypothetical protein [Pseudomonas aeruginosa]HCF2525382.1 hypothetical protein [Pseudomonas aeruginosa]HDQ4058835.1 hypothetical protein [Pseudomonas aeruginosa]
MAASTAGSSGQAVAIEVEGVRYPSARQAASALGLPVSTVQRRAHLDHWPTYRWLGATPGKRHVRTPEDCEVAKAIIEPTPWALDGGTRRANVLDPNFDPPRVIRRVGWVRCMRCQRFHFSGDVVAVRLCSVCGGAGGWPVGADPDADA